MFDPQWRENGHMDRAVELVRAWCEKQAIPGLKLEVVKLEKRTPLIFMEIPGDSDDTVLLYGHLDKQPEMVGWPTGRVREDPSASSRTSFVLASFPHASNLSRDDRPGPASSTTASTRSLP
jgi:hypothetical protein